MTKNKIKLILAAMVFGLAACHDTEEVTLQNGVRVAPAVYSTEQVTTEPVEEGGEAQTKEVPTLTARYYCNSDEYATPTSVGFVYTTDPEKDPTLLDNVITGVTYDEEVPAPVYSPDKTETGYFIKAEIPKVCLRNTASSSSGLITPPMARLHTILLRLLPLVRTRSCLLS